MPPKNWFSSFHELLIYLIFVYYFFVKDFLFFDIFQTSKTLISFFPKSVGILNFCLLLLLWRRSFLWNFLCLQKQWFSSFFELLASLIFFFYFFVEDILFLGISFASKKIDICRFTSCWLFNFCILWRRSFLWNFLCLQKKKKNFFFHRDVGIFYFSLLFFVVNLILLEFSMPPKTMISLFLQAVDTSNFCLLCLCWRHSLL